MEVFSLRIELWQGVAMKKRIIQLIYLKYIDIQSHICHNIHIVLYNNTKGLYHGPR
jgi:hypothetical protein